MTVCFCPLQSELLHQFLSSFSAFGLPCVLLRCGEGRVLRDAAESLRPLPAPGSAANRDGGRRLPKGDPGMRRVLRSRRRQKRHKPKMADDQRLLTDERSDKRKCDDFAALYGLEGATAARALPDHSGKSFPLTRLLLPVINSINQPEL
ncbi:hypothetical protein CEXT_667391 [Caerostris extrusa]|uniref:Uncharacterized protein n=1 Tax=Caerostris extrusa TaxID=172846 RepID=A0AAV4UWH6_CAEEX|nr:hypothetical protein CEXT_667391 [Caerostris extrusa]